MSEKRDASSAKPELHIVGPSKGAPTSEDIGALYKSLTGKDATPEELERVKRRLEQLPK